MTAKAKATTKKTTTKKKTASKKAPKKIYPKPKKRVLTIEIDNKNQKEKHIWFKVYDALGKKILNFKIVNRKPEIDLSKHPAGVYQLEIITENGVIHKQVIIE